MAHIDDRWFRTVRQPDGTRRKEKTPRHGTGLRWKARYLDPDGRERSRSFDVKSTAERFLTEVEHSKFSGTYRDPDAGMITLRKFSELWLAQQGFDPVTREAVESRLRLHILPTLGDKRLAELASRPSLVQSWVSGLRMAPTTTRKVFMHLNSIMLVAIRDGKIGSNPCHADIKLPTATARRITPWTPQQGAAVRAGLPEHLRALVDAGTGLGLRQSELFGLAVEEIEFMPGRSVHIRQQVKLIAGRLWFAPPKGKKERTVPLAGPTSLILSAHIAEYARPVTLLWHEPDTKRHGKPRTATLLFTTPDGRALHRNGFNEHTWHQAREAAGLSDDRVNGCHMMRHIYASTLIARGVDPRTVAGHLGHSDGGALVLRTYSHLMPDAEDRTRRAIEDALSDAAGQSNGPETAPGQVRGL